MIKNHLSRLMGERRWKIQDLSTAAGISYTSAFDLYHEKAKRIDLPTLDKLCRALGVGVGDILEYRQDATADQ